jgi:glycosyltransferase involved in cell wall biosynthesis
MSVANRVDHLPVVDARRGMVITTNFPPDASVGTIRTLRLIRCLAHDGWHVDVITAAPERFRVGTVIDDALLQKIPSGVHVGRVRAWRPLERLAGFVRGSGRQSPATPSVVAASADPASFASEWSSQLLRAARACLALPDREISWMLPAIAAGWRAARRRPPDVIYSSGPPFTAHLVGAAVARLSRRPWVADFRDPWARAPWRENRFAFEKKVWSVLERYVVTSADTVVFVTETNRDDFARYYGDALASRFHVVPNGCDVTDLDGLTRRRHAPSERFVLLHAGSMYGARNPTPLLNAVAKAISRGSIDRQRVRIKFIGRIFSDVNIPLRVRELGLDDVVEFVNHLPRQAVLQEMLDASALLIVQPITTVSVPAKLYEYMAANRPVLALAEPGGETAEIVRRSGAGVAVAADDEEAIERAFVSLAIGRHEPFAQVDPAAYDGALRAHQITRILSDVADHGAELRHDAVRHGVPKTPARREVTHS